MTRRSEWDGRSLTELAHSWDVPFVEAHARIGSTNDRAAQLAKHGGSPGTVIVTDEQTAGRGRRGSVWQSPAKMGLWMSVLVGDRAKFPQLPLLVGLACAEGIEAHVDGVRVEVKWPNDLLIGGRKVGGILCEATETGVVVGIGVNVMTPSGGFPREISSFSTSLEAEGGNMLSRSGIASQILSRLMSLLEEDEPFLTALPDLRRRDALLGTAVETERYGSGLACGLDPSGALIVERSDGTRVSVTLGSVRPA